MSAPEIPKITALDLDAAGVPRWYQRLFAARRAMNEARTTAAYTAAGARFDETWRQIATEYRQRCRRFEVVP